MDLIDEEMQQLLELFVNERLGIFYKKNPESRKRKMQRYDKFVELLNQEALGLIPSFNDLIDGIIARNYPDEQNLYCLGVRDAIRFILLTY